MVSKKLFALLPLSLALVGCNAHQQAAAPMPQAAPQFSMGQQSPMGMASMQQTFQQPMMQQQMPATQTQNADMQQQLADIKDFTAKEVSNMGERVRRVERAMIRLDRRMQVIERNELAKVSGIAGGETDQQNSAMNMGRFQPTSFTSTSNGEYKGQQASPFARGAAILSRTPFASRGHVNTQDLNSNSVMVAPLQPAQPQVNRVPSGQQATGQRFASLADAKTDRSGDTNVAIWTVNYTPRKIWPDRTELSASSEVVTALREGRPVSVFARGARPSSKEFRERVRALSRYLGRVANLESVPIAAMPADHLNTDTIELLVAN